MSNEGMIEQHSKSQSLVESMNEQIMELQQRSLEVLEKKTEGLKEVSIEGYEELLNWSIETLRIIRDHLE